MIFLYTHGWGFNLIENVVEISYSNLESINFKVGLADGSQSQYHDEENEDIIYLGY